MTKYAFRVNLLLKQIKHARTCLRSRFYLSWSVDVDVAAVVIVVAAVVVIVAVAILVVLLLTTVCGSFR